MSDQNVGNHREDPRQTGRLAAYRLMLCMLTAAVEPNAVPGLKAVVRQALRGDLLKLNQTASPDSTLVREWGTFLSLQGDLGGFGEGLRIGLEELLEVLKGRVPDAE